MLFFISFVLLSPYVNSYQVNNENQSALIRGIYGQQIRLPCLLPNHPIFSDSNPTISKIVWIRMKSGDILTFNTKILIDHERHRLIHNQQEMNYSYFDNDLNHRPLNLIKLDVLDLIINKLESSDTDDYICDILWSKSLITSSQQSSHVNTTLIDKMKFLKRSLLQNEHGDDSSKFTRNTIHLEVLEHPTFLSNTSTTDQNVVENSSITLRCSAVGNPPPEIRWFVKFHHVEMNHLKKTVRRQTTVMLKTTGNEYQVHVDKYETTPDEYECVASNGIDPAVSRIIRLNIQGAPMCVSDQWSLDRLIGKPKKRLKKTTETMEVEQRRTVTLNCWIRSNPHGTIFWRRLSDNLILFDHNTNNNEKYYKLLDKFKIELKRKRRRNQRIIVKTYPFNWNSTTFRLVDRGLRSTRNNGNIFFSQLIISNVTLTDYSPYECNSVNAFGQSSALIIVKEKKVERKLPHPSTFNMNKFTIYHDVFDDIDRKYQQRSYENRYQINSPSFLQQFRYNSNFMIYKKFLLLNSVT
ncbi:hypothetical protein SNEBB_010773 [Seison nebaliae]|nr:hypothetical protein SNEBB_010773 [Seison nebaliae]